MPETLGRGRGRARFLAPLGRAVRAVVVLLTLGFAASGLTVLTNASAEAAMSSDSYEQEVQTLDQQGARCARAAPLRFHACTDSTAEQWAQHLASSGRLVHQSAPSTS